MRKFEFSEQEDLIHIRHAARIYFRIKNTTKEPCYKSVSDEKIEVIVDPETILVVVAYGDDVECYFRNAQTGKRSIHFNNPALAVVSYKRGITYATE